jgi:polar amino acid transport system substrate-binding protein
MEDSSAPSGYSGFDIDIMQAIADNLNVKLVVMDSDFDTIQSGAPMAAGNCDVGASAITVTNERKANLDFSDAYYDSLQSLLVPKSSGITSLDDLAGKNIGIQAGTTGEIYAKANAPASANLVAFPSEGEMWPALQAGQVDALLEDYPVNMSHAKADSSYTVVAKYQTDEQYAFAVAKDKNPDLLKAINDGLQALRDDGTSDTLYSKYFS